jgi:pimeloyl-ACP methyl ester carboxylesterase
MTTNTTLETVTSADGTPIAVDRRGAGAPVILVGGAFNERSEVAGVADALASAFTAVTYDRRGRGDSGDAESYSPQLELDDLAAVIDLVGGSAAAFGHSSGGNLLLEAAAAGIPLTKVAVYEPSVVVPGTRELPGADLADRLQALIREDRPDDAAALFLTEQVQLPPEMLEGMKFSPFWATFVKLAHTLPYDVTLCGPSSALPAERFAKITVPVLVIDGDQSPPPMRAGSAAVAEAIPGARYLSLEGQDHGVLHQPEALRPVLTEFFG